jgi:hypothetical protein
MLAEFLNQLHVPPVPEALSEIEPRVALDWKRDRLRYEMVLGSMEKHLLARYQATSVEIRRLEHRLPSSDEVLVQKIPLNDPRFYIEVPDDPVEAQDVQFDARPPLTAPTIPPLMIPPAGVTGNEEEVVP